MSDNAAAKSGGIAKAFADLLAGKLQLRCTVCGETKCDCWERCTCGWSARKGEPCRNPATARCSTKVKYGKYNRKTKRYEKKENSVSDPA